MTHELRNNTSSMIKSLIKKDWHFNKIYLIFYFLVGLVSVGLLCFENRAFYVGMVLLLSILILIGAVLVTTTVINERKNKTLVFIMSLPISYMDYTKAKMSINLLAYLTIWFLLVFATVSAINFSEHIPNGLTPYAMIILIELMVAFILILGTALVTESEKWTIVVMTITNIGVSLFMFFIASLSEINKYMQEPHAIWNSTALKVIGIEILIAFMLIALTFYLQSRKKEFI